VSTFEENIQTANIFFEQGDLEKALSYYQQGYQQAPTPEYQIDILNILAQLELRRNNPKAAADHFEQSLSVFDSLPDERIQPVLNIKAAILNNLGLLYAKTDASRAILLHKKALAIFEQLAEEHTDGFALHLANTHFSLGEIYLEKRDFYMARKSFKTAISFSEHMQDGNPLTARAHYHLGELEQEEADMYKAQNHYKKAVQIYEQLTQTQAAAYRPALAATLNNLGVVFKTWEKYGDAIKYYMLALEQYEVLLKENETEYAPFCAATLNSLAIVYTEKHEVKDDFSMGGSGFSGFGLLSVNNWDKQVGSPTEEVDKQMAIDYYRQTIDIYNKLADAQPDTFTHYLATALHNLAVLYDEKKEPVTAEAFYKKALALRQKLADKNPNAFGADVAVTILNLLTIYQSFMEEKTDLSYKDLALGMLDEVETRLAGFDENKAVIKSMKSDLEYFRSYFAQADLELLTTKAAFRKTDTLTEEIESVLDPLKKLELQEQVLHNLKSIYQQYPGNEKLTNELHYAYADYAWYAIRSNRLDIANTALSEGKTLVPDSDVLDLQKAHLLHAEGQKQQAEDIYNRLGSMRNPENEPYKKIISDHLERLKKEGILSA
jgi:tetratricopeptide (TPR) repeat protein